MASKKNESGNNIENKAVGTSLWKIRPFPKYERPENKKRKKVVASIITSTPVKKRLEEKVELENQKEEAKKSKMQKRQRQRI